MVLFCQTVPSRLTGISSFTQSLLATRRWNITRSARGTIVKTLLEKAQLTKQENPNHELRVFRTQRDSDDLQNILTSIDETIDPLENTIVADKNQYSLSSGKPLPEVAKDDILPFLKKVRREKRYSFYVTIVMHLHSHSSGGTTKFLT